MSVPSLLPLLAGLLMTGATTLARAEVPPGCAGDPVALDPLLEREASIAHYAGLPDACRKALFRECSVAAGKNILDVGTAAVCSLRYEGLLRGSFQGDFQALMGWWRAQRPALQ